MIFKQVRRRGTHQIWIWEWEIESLSHLKDSPKLTKAAGIQNFQDWIIMTNDKKWTNQSILKFLFSKTRKCSSWQNTNKTDDRSGFTTYFLTGMKLIFACFVFFLCLHITQKVSYFSKLRLNSLKIDLNLLSLRFLIFSLFRSFSLYALWPLAPGRHDLS